MRRRARLIDTCEAGALVGRLSVCDYDDVVLHRRVRRVDLVTLDRGGLVKLGDDALALTGFERPRTRRQASSRQCAIVVGAAALFALRPMDSNRR